MAVSPPSDRAGPKENSGDNRTPVATTPRWVKAFGIAALVAFVLFAALHLTGKGLGGHAAHHGHAPTHGGHE